MTEPPVPPDLDLRDFQYMPLDVARLVDSDLNALSSGDEFRTAVILWCKAWHQVPASSLPDDDRLLAHLSGFGRDIKGWQKVREVALRGFEKYSDGRLYHGVIAEKALEALSAKMDREVSKHGDLERKKRERDERAKMFGQLRAAGVTPAWNTPTCDLRELVTDLSHATRDSEHGAVTPPVTEKSEPVTPPVTDLSRPVTPPVTPPVTAKNRIEGNRIEEKEVSTPYSPPQLSTCVEAWNAELHPLGIPKIQHLSDTRRTSLPLRLAEIGGVDGWLAMIGIIKRSPHLLGQNDRGWKVTFDWVLLPRNLTKIMEGNYVNGARGDTSNIGELVDFIRERTAESQADSG
jgi:hypothetical protein